MRLLSMVPNSDELVRIGAGRENYITHDSESPVFVIFTSTNATLKAVEKAEEAAKLLRSGIVLVAAQMVPFPLPVDKPLISIEVLSERLETVASQVTTDFKAFLILCRDPLEALINTLSVNSPVFLGVEKSFWPNRDKRLGQKLRRQGFPVFLVEPN